MAAGGEPYRVFNSLVVRAVRELAACLAVVGGSGAADKAAAYSKTADSFATKIRAAQPVDSFHLHSAAHATNAGVFGSTAARPARTRLFFAAWSVRRALLTPQVNPGSLCRCGKST